ncbi:MAG: hypothetical protein ACFCUI_13675 [Bernardetiaceae bacterium]
MKKSKLEKLLREAKFDSLFEKLNQLNLDTEDSQQRTTLQARHEQYKKERYLMDTRDYQTAMGSLIADLQRLVEGLDMTSAKEKNDKQDSGNDVSIKNTGNFSKIKGNITIGNNNNVGN